MPGANIQFQFWFTPMVPILIEMVGLPHWLTFFIYGFLYPVKGGGAVDTEPRNAEITHLFMIGLCLWLLTIGPCDSWLERLGLKKVKTE